MKRLRNRSGGGAPDAAPADEFPPAPPIPDAEPNSEDDDDDDESEDEWPESEEDNDNDDDEEDNDDEDDEEEELAPAGTFQRILQDQKRNLQHGNPSKAPADANQNELEKLLEARRTKMEPDDENTDDEDWD